MERLKKKYFDLSLKKAFVLTVLITFCIVAVLSGLSIWGCVKIRQYLLPESDALFLTIELSDKDGNTVDFGYKIRPGEETNTTPHMEAEQDGKPIYESYDLSTMEAALAKVENSYDMLSPRRRIVYRGCGVLMVVLPAVFSVTGILLCGAFFYRQKLNKPLKLLSEATERIADRELDYTLSYDSGDEMGNLCRSFEQMRHALEENNRELWKTIEEQRIVQASIAHDLRNPIAIIEGYSEYLQINLPSGNLTTERVLQITDNLHKATNRLGQYTESIHAINKLNDVEIRRAGIHIEEFIDDIFEDLSLMAEGKNIKLNITGEIPKGVIDIDVSVLYRVLENIFNNALRYANEVISLSFEMDNRMLAVSVVDDGAGFPEEILKNKNRLFVAEAGEDGHLGLGLTISRLLLKRHNGHLELSNNSSGGAAVKMFVEI